MDIKRFKSAGLSGLFTYWSLVQFVMIGYHNDMMSYGIINDEYV